MAVEEVLQFAKEAHRDTPRKWCLMVLVDIKNAFNTANWERIIASLEAKGVSTYLVNEIKDYLTNRSIYKDRRARVRINFGVPQGSVLGPTLWNSMYDGLLRVVVPEDVKLVAYADDLAIMAADRDLQRVVEKANVAIDVVRVWLSQNGLRLAPEKTEAIMLRFGRRKQEVAVVVDGVRIEAKTTVKYLGVTLDGAVRFGPHIRAAAKKAEKTVNALGRLMPNVGGPDEERRRMLGSVAQSILLYGAPIWAGAMGVMTHRRTIQSVQRKIALRICRAYRTVSFDATTVVASTIPIHLLVEERRIIYGMGAPSIADRSEVRRRTLEKWQEEWAAGTKGQWTRDLIGDVRPWFSRKHGKTTFHLTQLLTGHGAFKSYTHRIGKTEDDMCGVCGEPDTAEHVIFTCKVFERERAELNNALGIRVTKTNLIAEMIKTQENWNQVARYAAVIMGKKEDAERT